MQMEQLHTHLHCLTFTPSPYRNPPLLHTHTHQLPLDSTHHQGSIHHPGNQGLAQQQLLC